MSTSSTTNDALLKQTLGGFRELADLQRGDHDTLIRIETTQTAYVQENRQSSQVITDKVMDLTKTVEGINSRVHVLETAREIERGRNEGRGNLRRTIIEIVTLLALIGTFYATWLLTRGVHH